MPTYLMTWNPNNFDWTDEHTRVVVSSLDAGVPFESNCSTGSRKNIEPGDRLFFMKLGVKSKGIYASGRATSGVYQDAHYDDDRAEAGDEANYVKFTYDEFFDPLEGPPLTHDVLYQHFPGDDRWSPQGSGTQIPTDIEVSLEELWQKHLNEGGKNSLQLVTTLTEVRQGVWSFDKVLEAADEAARFAVFHPEHFLYEPVTGAFAPAKWAGFRGMTAPTYRALQNLQREQGSFRGFDGARVYPRLSKSWGQFRTDPDLTVRLVDRFKSAFGNDIVSGREISTLKFLVLPPSPERFWWVNQGKSYQQEVSGGFIRAPQHNKQGGTYYYWSNVASVQPADLIFSYSGKHISAIGQAASPGYEEPKSSQLEGHDPEEDRWVANVRYYKLQKPVPLSAINQSLASLKLDKGPVNATGTVTQGYLFELSREASQIILDQISETIPMLESSPSGGPAPDEGRKSPTSEPVNLILYGPPGTGKTYRSIAEAVKLCDGTLPASREEITARFAELREQSRVEFVTFHQSFGYEEFVEGIRPVLDEHSSGDDETLQEGEEVTSDQVSYVCYDGVFKRLCNLARESVASESRGESFDPKGRRIWKMSLGNTRTPEGDEVYEECIEKGEIALGYGRGIDYTGCEDQQSILQKLRSVNPEGKETKFSVAAVDRFKNKMQEGDLVVVSEGNLKFRAIGVITGGYEPPTPPNTWQLRKVRWLRDYDESLPREKLLRKIFSQATIYELKPKVVKFDALVELLSGAGKSGSAAHVLIVDEINRGNVAKILGELITLLEPDKRLGMLNEIQVRLPYSGDNFGVPSNLHVIGTMNTADRSIAFLDTALRRRFRFEEMMPDASLIRTLVGDRGTLDGVDLAALLETLNERIELLYDRDHTLGHSYFLGVRTLENLRDVFLEKLIPLLQEYFYDDWTKICVILGCPSDGETGNPLSKNESPMIAAKLLKASALPGGNESDYESRVSYRLNPEFTEASRPEIKPFFTGVGK